MLLTKEVEIGWSPTTQKHYEELGYEYEWRSHFIVPVEHLTDNSHAKVDILCDYCLEEGIETKITKTWQKYNESKENGIIHKDCCKKHWYKKCSESNQEIYGVSNQFERDEIKDKIIETNLDKYGVEFYTQTDEYKQCCMETCLDKYGVDNVSRVPEFIDKMKNTQINKYGMMYSQTNEYKERYKNTCQEKYGVDNAFQSDEVKQKIIKFNNNTYGCHPMKIEEIKQDRLKKMLITKYKNGTGQSSRQQDYLGNLFNGEVNYPVNYCCLDIAFIQDKIFCEFDGSGHSLCVKMGDLTQEEFNNKEKRRKYFLLSKGWKEVRIISLNDKLPSDEVLLEMLNYAKEYINTGHSWIKFDIDNSKVICSQYEKDYDFGVLRKIKEEDLKEVG